MAAYMRDRGMSQAELANRTNLGKTTINNYLRGRNGASPQNRLLIAEALGVRPEQLMMPYTASGEGVSAAEPGQSYLSGRYLDRVSEEVELRFVPYTAYGSFVAGCQDRSYGDHFELRRVKRVPGKDYNNAHLLEIRGNSMAPRYPDSSRYVVRPVSDGNWQYATGVHAISLRGDGEGEGMFVIKRIRSNKDGVLLLTSDNNDQEMTVQLGDILCMWKVGEADYLPEED